MSTLANKPAFPGVSGEDGYGESVKVHHANGAVTFTNINQGMTLRQFYAGLAMQGILSARPNPQGWIDYAQASIDMADALIHELEKEVKP